MIPNDRPAEPIESQGEFALPRQMTVTTEKGQKSIADRLMKIRKDRGMTQIDMAKKLKTSQSIYSRYERGEMRLHAEMLLAVSKILSVTPNDILGVTKSGNPINEQTSDEVIPKRFLRALRGIDKLTKTQQDSLLLLIDATVNHGRKKRTDSSTESTP